ncbi:MAG: GtrA family protein [bacterium]|nr:GtrA family protein [bacterium]
MIKYINSQFLKFVGIGISNTAVDFIILNLILFFGDGEIIWFMMSKTISFLGASTNSFFWNKYWTFKSSGKFHQEIFPFIVISGIALIINVSTASILFRLFIDYLPSVFAANVSAVFASLVAFSCNFFGYKYFVFHRK